MYSLCPVALAGAIDGGNFSPARQRGGGVSQKRAKSAHTNHIHSHFKEDITMTELQKQPGKGVGFERIRRITGYLVGTMDKWNDAKKAEESERVKHNLPS